MSRSSSPRRARRRLTSRGRPGVVAITTGLAAAAALVTLGAGTASAAPAFPSFHPSTVYTETNQVAGNSVLAYRADPGGGLTPIGSSPTGGTGTGVSPSSQGGVTLGDNGQLLAVVNGGSNSVSVFLVEPSGNLQFIETTNSGGVDPISVTVHGLSIYTLNAGNATTAANIAGFNLFGGLFSHHSIGVQSLNPAANSPEQISYTPSGRDLVVTEKGSNTIDVFPVDFFGLAQPPVTTTLAANAGPYGFAFTPSGVAVVSEAAFGGVATFSVEPDGAVSQISQVADGQLAPCWIALTANANEAFTANAHSGTISAYTVAPNGTLSLLSPAVQASPGVGDTDLAVTNSSLYISDQPDFDVSAITPSGSLSPSVPVASALPAGTFGLAATDSTGFGF
jgi:6-phosphogluconolactonase